MKNKVWQPLSTKFEKKIQSFKLSTKSFWNKEHSRFRERVTVVAV